MHSENIKRLMAELGERRKLHEEALSAVQKSVYAFRNGLTDVKCNLESTAQRFSDMVCEPGILESEAIIVQMHRRAS